MIQKYDSWNNCPQWLKFLYSSLTSPTSKAVKSKIYLVWWEREKQTWQLSCLLFETKVRIQENWGFLFFSLPRENRLCFLWEVLRGTCTLSATFWNHKQDQTTSCKALNIAKEKLLLSLSQGVPQAGETWPAYLKWDKGCRL